MRVTLRRFTLAAIVILFVLIAAVLAYGNQELISLDLGFVRLDEVSLTVTLAVTFALGAVFGGLISVLSTLRHMSERRALRRELRRAEARLASLSGLPLQDAD